MLVIKLYTDTLQTVGSFLHTRIESLLKLPAQWNSSINKDLRIGYKVMTLYM